MNCNWILGYHLLTGTVEIALGVFLVSNPGGITGPQGGTVYLALTGMFVFTLGLSALVGAYLVARGMCALRLQLLWLQSGLIHAGCAIFITGQIALGSLAPVWSVLVVGFAAMALAQGSLLRIRIFKVAPHSSRKLMEICRQSIPSEWHRWIH